MSRLLSDPRQTAALAGAVSGVLLLAALGFQAAGYAPCELCVLQRWPHLAAAIIGAVIWFAGFNRWLAALGAVAATLACGFAIFHAGVELGWWPGPAHCSGGIAAMGSLSPAELVRHLNTAPVVRCDEVAWSFLGVSMAGWNALISAALMGMWGLAASDRDRAPRKRR